MAYSLSIAVTQNSQDITNNRSNVTVNVNCSWTYGTWSAENLTKYCTIEGTTHYFNDVDINPKQTKSGSSTLFTWTGYIPHNSDGTKTLSVYASTATSTSSGTQTASNTTTLTTIARKSTVSATNAVVGSNSTITISRKSSAFTHTLTYTFGSLSGTIATKTSSTSVAFTLPTTFYAQIGANATSKAGTITCTTYNGSTAIGSTTCSFTATTSQATCAPTLSPTVTDVNNATIALTGDANKFVKYYSTAAVTFGAAARNSATLSSKSVSNSGKSRTSDGNITKVTSGTFEFSAKDSRGYTASKTITKTLIDYVKLTCSFNVKITVDGTATITTQGNYFNGSFGATSNTLTVQYRYRESGGSFGSWVNMTTTKSSNNYNTTATISGLDYQTLYEFEVKAADKLTTITPSPQSIKAQPVFDWGENDFNFNVPVTFAKKIAKQYLELTFSASGKRFGCIPEIGVDGVMEVGKYIDFHETNADTSDYSVRITSSSNGIDIGKGLSIGGTKVVDFVVEQGVRSGWTYRKWNSGIAEAWRKTTSTNLGTQGTINGWYWRIYDMALPSGLFKTITDAHADCYWNTGMSFASARAVDKTTFQAIYFSNANGGAGTFYHYVAGTWK